MCTHIYVAINKEDMEINERKGLERRKERRPIMQLLSQEIIKNIKQMAFTIGTKYKLFY